MRRLRTYSTRLRFCFKSKPTLIPMNDLVAPNRDEVHKKHCFTQKPHHIVIIVRCHRARSIDVQYSAAFVSGR